MKTRHALIGILLVVVAGCGSSSSVGSTYTVPKTSTASGSSESVQPRATEAPTTTAAPKAVDLNNVLLSVNDMPAGWAVDNGDNSAPKDCLSFDKNTPGAVARADVAFAKDGAMPVFSQSLAAFKPADAKAGMDQIVAALNSCKSFSITEGGESYTGTLGELSFPDLGVDQQAAYQKSISAGGLTAVQNVVVIRRGNIVMEAAYGDMGTTTIDEIKPFVDKAIAKLP